MGGFKQWAVLSCAAFLAACAGGGGGAAPPVAFEITAITPFDGTSDVPPTEQITVFFSKSIDPTSVNSVSFRVIAESGDEIPGNRTVPQINSSQIRFNPILPYLAFAIHRVHVSADVRDVSGVRLGADQVFEFQAMEAGPTLPKQTQLENLGDALRVGRWLHRMTPLLNNRFLVAGGYTADGSVTDRAENLVPSQKQSFDIVDRMSQARAAHEQVLLHDGRVLLAGGESSDTPFVPLASCELFDPDTLTFSPAAPMNFPRSLASSTVLLDGRVLVTGGQSLDGGIFVFRNDAEIYDPLTDTWTPVPANMAAVRSGHFMATTGNGDALVIGGVGNVASSELWSATTGLFEASQGIPVAPHFFGAGAVMLDGRVLVAGGSGSTGITLFSDAFGFLNSINTMQNERAFATATAFLDGRVLIVGGIDLSINPALIRNTVDIWIPIGDTGKVFRIPAFLLPKPTTHHAAGLGPGGSVWICGGLPQDLQDPALRQVLIVHPE